jgi:NAD(P)-dependent dehydrogenase (short-subunit alcohol dehydrogenase family)
LAPKWLKIDFAKAGEAEYREIFSPTVYEGTERKSYQPGEVSILINNVGTSITTKPVFESDPQEIENIIKTNIFSYVMCTKHYISEVKRYRQDKQSYIIYTASIVSDIRNPMSSAFYQASKVANLIFARNTYYPRSLPIETMIIKPGWVSTNLTKNR